MLKEYALVPDIFDETSYTTKELCPQQMNTISELVLDEGIASNLYDGEWSKYLTANAGRFNKAANELIKTARTENRFVRRPHSLSTLPSSDLEWGDEALSSHRHISLDGILVSRTNFVHYGGDPIVASVESLQTSGWWKARSSSVRLTRTTADYRRVLSLILGNANSLMFIDPHLDVTRDGKNGEKSHYGEFQEILLAAERVNRNLNPKIEIHRVSYIGSGKNKTEVPIKDWEASFKRILAPILRPKDIKVEVFIWDDFHDRYLISNLIGILIPNGFDVEATPQNNTTWTRLGRKERDDIQREFNPASNRHNLKHQFTVP
jgi:hypothetical protein